MIDLIALLQCTQPYVTATPIRQLSHIIAAILAMTGRVTMLGVSRWTGKGGSYRTIQRFYHSMLPWAVIFWLFFRQHLLNPADVYFMAADETVVSKAGDKTHGLERFFSSLAGKPIPGLCFLALSLVSRQQRRSYPTMVEQVVRNEANAATTKEKKRQANQKKAGKGKPGRPKGSKNRDKTQVTLTPDLELLRTMILKQLRLINGDILLSYIALDGKYGNNNAVQMVRGCGLHIISKLRHDSALYFAYDGPYAGRGPHRKYGDKVNYDKIPTQYLRQTMTEKEIRTNIYQAQLLHSEFAQPLNVVVIHKTNLNTKARAHVVLFSTDLTLAYEQLMDYYSLRFQLEFNFRDAKQYWGLEDFMNIKQTAVTNAANLSLFMVNVCQSLLQPFRQENPDFGVLDLKAHFRGHKYVVETIKLLPQKPEPILMARIFDQISRLGSVHHVPLGFNSS